MGFLLFYIKDVIKSNILENSRKSHSLIKSISGHNFKLVIMPDQNVESDSERVKVFSEACKRINLYLGLYL